MATLNDDSRESSELTRRVARTMREPDLNFEWLDSDLRDAALNRSDQISEILKDRIARRDRILLTDRPKWSDLFVAQPVDHSFWWPRRSTMSLPARGPTPR
jgi:hypothetical protein